MYHNGAVPATGAYYFVNCLSRHVHPSADLVLLDFAVNGASVRDTEGIVRRLLAAHGGLSYSPLIFFVNFWNNWPGRNDEFTLQPWRSLIASSGLLDDNESHITVVATYYDCMCASMRYAYLFEDIHREPGFEYENYINGGNHPNERGHRMMADLVIHELLRQSFARNSLPGSDAPLVPRVYPGFLPPPIVDGNTAETAVSQCSFGSELQAQSRKSEGWTYEASAEKPGLWANASGSELVLALQVGRDTTCVKVFFLRSWVADMGAAALTCLPSACTCDGAELDGHGGSHSVMAVQALPLHTGGGEGLLQLVSLRGRFKLLGLAAAGVAHEHEAHSFEHEAAPARRRDT